MFLKKLLVCSVFLPFFVPGSWAGPTDFQVNPGIRSISTDARFAQNRFEFSLTSGAFFSPFKTDLLPPTHTSFDYTQTEIRAGWMLNSPYDAGIFSGNFEILLGLGGGAIFQGPGHALGNGDTFIRYNFVQKRAPLVPYFQLGAGLVVSDAADDHTQRIIGRTLEASLQAGLGFKILLAPKWSLDLEADYQHISNANTANRNVGVNALGGLIGVSRCF
jgi:hypothetical protein